MKLSIELIAALLLAPLATLTAAELNLKSPRDFQVVQRSSPGLGMLRVTGELSEDLPSTDTLIEARLLDEAEETPWLRVGGSVAGRAINGTVEIPAGGWWRLEVRVSRASEVAASGVVEHVGIGEVFVVAGQSNSANHGEEKQRPQSGRVAAFDGQAWRLADDSQLGASRGGGSFIPPFADAVVAKEGVPVGNQQDPTRTLPGHLYREYLEKLIRESRRDIGWDAPWFVAQASYHVPGDEASEDIRVAQASLWQDGIANAGPDSDALKGKLRERNGAGVHFSGQGLREHGTSWAVKVLPWLDQQWTEPRNAHGGTQ